MRAFHNTGFAVALFLLFMAGPVRAQFGMEYGLVGAPMSSFLNDSYLSNHYLMKNVIDDMSALDAARDRLDSASRAGDTAALVAPTGGKGRMAARLAQNYPASQQPQAEALFEDLLSRYAQLESQFDIPHGDLGGALAAFVAGSWMGLHDASFPDAHFPPLVEQMRAVLAAEPALSASPDADRRDMYDQMAIIGMMLAATQMGLQQNPDAATAERMHDAAQGYLQDLFKVDAERVTLGPAGLSLR